MDSIIENILLKGKLLWFQGSCLIDPLLYVKVIFVDDIVNKVGFKLYRVMLCLKKFKEDSSENKILILMAVVEMLGEVIG